MKGKRYSEEQIIRILREVEGGRPPSHSDWTKKTG